MPMGVPDKIDSRGSQDLRDHTRADSAGSAEGESTDILDDFRSAIGNHLVAEMDPYDLDDRKVVHDLLCSACAPTQGNGLTLGFVLPAGGTP